MNTRGNEIPKGLITPIATPFDDQGDPAPDPYVRHAEWLLSHGCAAIAPFGTTGEANSLTRSEKRNLLEHLLEAGISAEKLIPGTGSCSIKDALALTEHALRRGCETVLLLPPFYYKPLSDEALFNYFRTFITAFNGSALKVILYHIPQISGIPITLPVLDRLVNEFPSHFAGIKDSSGSWDYTRSVIERLPEFQVFSGSEVFLSRNLDAGGAGCISATGNIHPHGISALAGNLQTTHVTQQHLDEVRTAVQAYPLVPAIKYILAHYTGHQGWRNVRVPFMPLSERDGKALVATLEGFGYSWPGRA